MRCYIACSEQLPETREHLSECDRRFELVEWARRLVGVYVLVLNLSIARVDDNPARRIIVHEFPARSNRLVPVFMCAKNLPITFEFPVPCPSIIGENAINTSHLDELPRTRSRHA